MVDAVSIVDQVFLHRKTQEGGMSSPARNLKRDATSTLANSRVGNDERATIVYWGDPVETGSFGSRFTPRPGPSALALPA